MKPLKGKLFIDPIEAQSTFILPDKQKPEIGKVLAIAEGDQHEFDIGDTVVFAKHRAHNLKVENIEIMIVEAEDVYAKILY